MTVSNQASLDDFRELSLTLPAQFKPGFPVRSAPFLPGARPWNSILGFHRGDPRKPKKSKILKIPDFCSIHPQIASKHLPGYSHGSKTRIFVKTWNLGVLTSGARPWSKGAPFRGAPPGARPGRAPDWEPCSKVSNLTKIHFWAVKSSTIWNIYTLACKISIWYEEIVVFRPFGPETPNSSYQSKF